MRKSSSRGRSAKASQRIMTTGVASMAVLPMALLGVVGAIAIPAAHAADVQTTTSAYSGYSSGSVIYANALNITAATDIAKAEIANSTAAVAENGPALTTSDTLLQPQLLGQSAAGKSAYGHASGTNVGLFTSTKATPAIKLTTAEAVSPPPASAASAETLQVPLSPLAKVDVLPGTAAANTTSAHACVATGTPISSGSAHVAGAQVLSSGNINVVDAPNTNGNAVSDSTTTTELVAPTTAAGAAIASPGKALRTQTTMTIAPLHLLEGTPGQIDITVLKPLVVTSEAGGVPGSAHVTYGFAGATASTVVLTLKIAAQPVLNITQAQLLGSNGIIIGLGAADITIGTKIHALGGLEGTAPDQAANGTTSSGSSDLIRITSPGSLTPGISATGPLGAILNPLDALVAPIGTGLKALAPLTTTLNAADIRIGHIDAQSQVPLGGVICKTADHPAPFDESYKDTSSTSVAAGKTFSYTVRFPNRGDLPVNNVKVVDTFTGGPPPLEFVSSVPAPASRSGNQLTYNFGTLQPGAYASVTLTFKVPDDAKANTQYHNTATISGTYNGLPVTKTVHVDAPTVLPLGPAGCNLSYSTKYASNKKVTTGENFAYYIDVLNAGATTCTDVTVKDTLTSGVTFVSCSNSCTHSGQNLSWSIGDLEPGASKVLQVVVHTTAKSGTLPNTADLSSTNGGTGSPHTPGPTVSTISVGNPAHPAGCPTSVCKVQPAHQLAFTGGLGPTTIALALLGSSGLLLMVRRRRAYDY